MIFRKGLYMRRFIVFTDEELDKIKAGELVVCRDCDFSNRDKPYDIFCVSEDWYAQYISEENLP